VSVLLLEKIILAVHHPIGTPRLPAGIGSETDSVALTQISAEQRNMIPHRS